MRDPALVHVQGPLSAVAEGFGVRLEVLGYARQSRAGHLRLMADLSGWLQERELDCSTLSRPVAEAFLADRRGAGHRGGRSLRSLRPLLEYLREVGAAPPLGQQQVVDPVEALLNDYARYLGRERSLTVQTVRREMDLVRPFLSARADGAGEGLGLDSLTAADVIGFMLARSQSMSPATVQRTGTALRSLLRFLHLRGRLSRSPWNLGGGPVTSGDVHEVILHHGSDILGSSDLALERGA